MDWDDRFEVRDYFMAPKRLKSVHSKKRFENIF
jgi:hypothetical protein